MNKKVVIILIILIIVITSFLIYNKLNETRIIDVISSGDKHEKLEDGLSSANFDGDDLFELFLNEGGAKSDAEVVNFLTTNVLSKNENVDIDITGSGCSTFQTVNKSGQYLFGRNFDWQESNSLVVLSNPTNGFNSISTVNMDFITSVNSSINNLPDQVKTLISLYAPLDGMNEYGLAVSVNMIEDGESIDQNTDKPDITTTTAIRLLLNKAKTTEEAIKLLESYDMHSSMGMMVHFMIADSEGNSVAVEYIDNEMVVTDTNILTNFYLADGDKQGIGSAQSHERFEILENLLNEKNTLEMDDVKDALDSVSKKNFNEFESTEWSIIFNQTTKEVNYYHRENYNKKYTFHINGDENA